MKILNMIPGLPSQTALWWSSHPIKFFTLIALGIVFLVGMFFLIRELCNFKDLGVVLTEAFREEEVKK